MKVLFRLGILLALIFGAFASYSAGFSTGIFFFVILGALLEAAFWFKIFPIKPTGVTKASSS